MIHDKRGPDLAFDVLHVCGLALWRKVGHIQTLADGLAGELLPGAFLHHYPDVAEATFPQLLAPRVSASKTAPDVS